MSQTRKQVLVHMVEGGCRVTPTGKGTSRPESSPRGAKEGRVGGVEKDAKSYVNTAEIVLGGSIGKHRRSTQRLDTWLGRNL